MSKKHLSLFAIIMVVVFLTITVAYPILFKPGSDSVAPVEAPVGEPTAPAVQ